MQRIVPHLWFATEAHEAAAWYTGIFPDSRVVSETLLRNTPSGDSTFVTFELMGYTFMAISAGPLFTPNPSVSYMMAFEASDDPEQANIDTVWQALLQGGKALMQLGEYPFSTRYGWVEDRYGFSWQLITVPAGTLRARVMPVLMFSGAVYGKAEEAAAFYRSVFKDTREGSITRYGPGLEPDTEDAVMYMDFMLEGQWFGAADSATAKNAVFNEANSLLVHLDTQEELDEYSEKLSSVPEAEQCGWIKDRYGVSWQMNPTGLTDMMHEGTPEQVDRLVQAFLPMKRLDIKALEAAFRGE